MSVDRSEQVVLAHTAAPPFVRQAALAFEEAAQLRLACIGLSTRRDDWLMRATRMLPGAGRLNGLLDRRRFEEVGKSRVRRLPYFEYLRLLGGRLDRTGILADRLWDFGTKRFDAWAARQLRPGDTAYGYEYGCLGFFQRAKVLNGRCIYEIPSAEHDWYERLMRTELDRFPDLRTPWHHATAGKQVARSKRRHDELALSDRVIVYSNHVVESYRASGFDTGKFRVVPLAAPPLRNAVREKLGRGPLNLIWAGTFGIRKGAHYLVEALERMPKGAVTLDIFGSYALSDDWRRRVDAVATFHGPVGFDELQTRIASAHALVLPSLSEAFGMVVTEAMASGTAVLVSSAVGATDLVQPDVTGVVVEPGSADSLINAMERLKSQQPNLGHWGQAAQAKAASWQWPDFRAALREACFGSA